MLDIYSEMTDNDVDALFSTEKERRCGDRRKKDYNKALRKKRIVEEYYNWPWYDNLHQYSKNKIHCSCKICRGKDFRNRHIETPQERKKRDYEKEFVRDWNNLRLDFEGDN